MACALSRADKPDVFFRLARGSLAVVGVVIDIDPITVVFASFDGAFFPGHHVSIPTPRSLDPLAHRIAAEVQRFCAPCTASCRGPGMTLRG